MSACTEEEAKKKWCPFARVVECGEDELYGPYNRHHSGCDVGLDNEQARCIASGCMAWRWKNSPDDAERYVESCKMAERPPFPPDTKATGYCGLAGKP